MAAGTANPPGQPGGFTIAAVRRAGLWVALVLDRATNIDEVVGTEAELGAPHLNHGNSSGVSIRMRPGGANRG